MIRFGLVAIVTMLYALPSYSQSWGILGGINLSNIEATNGNLSVDMDSDIGFQVGARYTQEMGGFELRTGAQINRYAASLSGPGGKMELSATQLQVPVTAQFMVHEMIGLFGGAAINFNLADDMKVNGTSSNPDFNSVFFALELGALIKFNEQFGLEAFYDFGLSEMANNVEGSFYGAQLVYFFE